MCQNRNVRSRLFSICFCFALRLIYRVVLFFAYRSSLGIHALHWASAAARVLSAIIGTPCLTKLNSSCLFVNDENHFLLHANPSARILHITFGVDAVRHARHLTKNSPCVAAHCARCGCTPFHPQCIIDLQRFVEKNNSKARENKMVGGRPCKTPPYIGFY